MDISKLLSEPDHEAAHHVDSGDELSSRSVQAGASHSRSSSQGKKSAGSKRATCDTCGNSFVSKAHLAIHDRTVHQGLKLYQCDICKTSFGQPGTLTRHKTAVHEKRRDHECSYDNCRKRFGSRWTLSVHERNVHQKIKPYVCSVTGCDKAFGNLWNQKKHESNVHNISHSSSEALYRRAATESDSKTGQYSAMKDAYDAKLGRGHIGSGERAHKSASASRRGSRGDVVVGRTRHRPQSISENAKEYVCRSQRARK